MAGNLSSDRILAAKASRLIRDGKIKEARDVVRQINDLEIRMKAVSQLLEDVPNKERNLNKIYTRNTTSNYSIPSRPSQAGSGDTIAYFQDITDRLVDHINQAQIVLGCVAWLTNPHILSALAAKDAVQIIVQKEDFLRPDYPEENSKPWDRMHNIRKLYYYLPHNLSHESFIGTVMHRMSNSWNTTIEAVRCVGYQKDKDTSTLPRMHHKFVLFCKYGEKIVDEYSGDYQRPIVPYAVWTGSFNFTNNSIRSLENAIYTENKDVVRGYFDEYIHVLSISEPLNWSSEWCAPEWGVDLS
jgi:hypothetical protein